MAETVIQVSRPFRIADAEDSRATEPVRIQATSLTITSTTATLRLQMVASLRRLYPGANC
jgi:hypothetical protein